MRCGWNSCTNTRTRTSISSTDQTIETGTIVRNICNWRCESCIWSIGLSGIHCLIEFSYLDIHLEWLQFVDNIHQFIARKTSFMFQQTDLMTPQRWKWVKKLVHLFIISQLIIILFQISSYCEETIGRIWKTFILLTYKCIESLLSFHAFILHQIFIPIIELT